MSTGWLALGGGLLLPLAFAPFGLWPLALLAMALLFHCWTGATVRQAAWRGWLFGLGLFGLGVSWVQVSIHQFGLPSYLFSVPVTLLFVSFMALYPALCGALVGFLAGRLPPALQWILLMPALWVLGEALRGWLLTGFPWLQLGTSQIDSALGGYSPLGGVYLTGFLCALSGGLLLTGLRTRRERVPALLLLALIWGGGGWLRGQAWTEPAGPPLEVAVVQGAVPQAIKWAPGQLEPTRRLYLELSRPFFGRADLVLWPETALPAFEHRIRPFLEAVDELAKVSGTDLVLGLPVREGRGRYYNALLSVGRSPGRYYKRHLVPFGEYLPLKAWLGGPLHFLRIPMSDFSAGHGRPLLEAAGRVLGASICYEDAFADEVIEALPQAQLLVNVSNDAWFGDSLAPHQHLQIARQRALETGRYLLRATNTGISAVIGPQGRLLARSEQFRPQAITAQVLPLQGETPFVRHGSAPVLVGLLLLVLLLAWWWRNPG